MKIAIDWVNLSCSPLAKEDVTSPRKIVNKSNKIAPKNESNSSRNN